MKFLVRDITDRIVLIDLDELRSRLPPGWKLLGPDIANHRSDPRYKLFGEMEVCDVTNASCYNNARIRDISESGLSIEPVDVDVNDTRKFLINPIFLDGVEPFELIAECRWVNDLKAGFKITQISPESKEGLQKFLRLFCYENHDNDTTTNNTGGPGKGNSE